MRRGSKPTLYELMSAGDSQPQSPSPKPEANPRTLRVPIGYLFVAAGVLVVLLATAYGIGFNRGEHAGRELRAQDQQDMLQRQTRMSSVSEVSEPGGGLAESSYAPSYAPSVVEDDPPQEASPVASAPSQTPQSPVSVSSVSDPVDLKDTREVGLNYYVIDHPSQSKVDQLITFCLENGLEARRTTTLGGGAKVYVLPGFPPGGGRNPEIIRLLDRIREVGILWKRLAPRQNSDFSTRYAEKYKGPARNG